MRTIRRLVVVVCITAVAALAHTVDTVFLRASLLPANVVPPVTGVTAPGGATILVHITETAAGVSFAVVDFEVDFNMPAAEIIGLSIHNGPAGTNADIVFETNVSPTNPVRHSGGVGRISRQVVETDRVRLARIFGQPPDQFYVNLRTAANPNGVMRGQLAEAELLVMRAHLSTLNENPPFPEIDASGSANIVALGVRNAAREIVSGAVLFDVNYRFGAPDGSFTGLHIHNGPVGINAGVVIQPSPGVALAEGIPATGTSNITRGSADINTGAALTALRGLFAGQAAGHYANLHTSAPGHGGGIIRGQLQYTGTHTLRLDLSPANVRPPVTGLNAEAVATVYVFVNRNNIGQITAGALVVTLNHQFPGATEFTGLNIHRGRAGTSGPIVISAGLPTTLNATGVGNIFRIINVSPETPDALAALNDVLANPENYYLNLLTAAHPNGAVRSQLAPAQTGPARIAPNGMISNVQNIEIAPASPGAIISIYGSDFVKVPMRPGDGLGLEGNFLPIIVNGTEVRIGNRQASIFYAGVNSQGFGQIDAQVPFETEPGNVPVVVVRSGEFSAPVPLAVTRQSPGIYPGAYVRNTDGSLVHAGNPAAAGEVVLIFGTGLGAVSPAVQSGQFTPFDTARLTAAEASVTIGGQRAEVFGAALTAGFVGLNQVGVRIPTGLPAGNHPVQITIGAFRSNAPPMAIR